MLLCTFATLVGSGSDQFGICLVSWGIACSLDCKISLQRLGETKNVFDLTGRLLCFHHVERVGGLTRSHLVRSPVLGDDDMYYIAF